jgi:hypothetical protein
MKVIRILILSAIAISLAGCELNERTFNEARPKLRQRQDIQADYMHKCTRRVKYSHIELKRHMAGFMHTEIDGLPEKVCGRMLRGYLSGRMKFQDFKALMTGQKFTPGMVQILRAG